MEHQNIDFILFARVAKYKKKDIPDFYSFIEKQNVGKGICQSELGRSWVHPPPTPASLVNVFHKIAI